MSFAVENTDWLRLEGWMLKLGLSSMEELLLYAYVYTWTCSSKGYAFVWLDYLAGWLFTVSKTEISAMINELITLGFVEARKINDERFGEERVLAAIDPFRREREN